MIQDGRSCRQQRTTCGVWMRADGQFCEAPTYSLRRCKRHYDALKKDGLWKSLHAMSKEQREKALDMLDDAQKNRDPWEFVGDEETLAAETAAKEGRENQNV